MILLSSIIATFEADYLAQYGATSPRQLKALEAMKSCRTSASAAIDPHKRRWRTKRGYLFNPKALAPSCSRPSPRSG
jgi:hypothetical protein